MSEREDTGGRLGQVIAGRFRLERILGQGGMAAVYLGKDEAGSAGDVAIKILHSEMAARKEVRERFLREGYVANQVDHPGAVKVLEHGAADGGTVYLVMELLDGDSFGERLKHEGKLPVDAVLAMLDQLLEVMAVAHDRGIVHRDIKPDNLFWTSEERVKVLDFGLARLHDSIPTEVRTRTGIAMGTLPYMAPEQALGRRAEIDGRTDLFAIGATALKLLTNRKVHEADSEAELLMAMASKPAPAVASVAPLVPVALAMIIDRALSFHRDARYPSAREMLEDVRAVREGKAPPVASKMLALEAEVTRPDRAAPIVAAAGAAGSARSLDGASRTAVDATLTQVDAPPRKRRLGLVIGAALGTLALAALAALALSGRSATPAAAASSARLAAAAPAASAPPAESAAPASTAPPVKAAPKAAKPKPAPAPREGRDPRDATQGVDGQVALQQASQAAARAIDASVKQKAEGKRERERRRKRE